MSSDLLASTNSKINRAKKHLAELEAEIAAYHRGNPYHIVTDKDTEPGYELYRFVFIKPIPCSLGSVIGDVIHNLRAALDTLATALVIANGEKSTAIIRKTYFPIGASEAIFEKKLPDDLAGASDAAREMVKGLKPYKGGTDAFYRLHQLDILDKHSALIPVGASNTRVGIKFPTAHMFETMGVTDKSEIPELPFVFFSPATPIFPLKNGDVIFKYGFGPDIDGKFKGEHQFALDIAFGEGQIIDGQPVVPSLNQFVDLVQSAVEIFDRNLFSRAAKSS
jgi:hypothetical protein